MHTGVLVFSPLTTRSREAAVEHLSAQGSAIQAVLDADHGLDDEDAETWLVRAATGTGAMAIEQAVDDLAARDVERIVGFALEPFTTPASSGRHHNRARAAAAARGLDYHEVATWHLDEVLLASHAEALERVRATLPDQHKVLFCARPLPPDALDDDPYEDHVIETATAIAARCGLHRWGGWAVAWQPSEEVAGPCSGPDVCEVIDELAATGRSKGVVVVPIGAMADDDDMIDDLDGAAADRARAAGLAFGRSAVVGVHDALTASFAARIAQTGRDPASDRAAHRSHTPARARRVVIVGAGMTGLVAARSVLLTDPSTELTVLDADQRVGGAVVSARLADRLVDCGPDTFGAQPSDAIDLVRDLGLDAALVTPDTDDGLIFTAGALEPLDDGLFDGTPTGPGDFAGIGVLSGPGRIHGIRTGLATLTGALGDDVVARGGTVRLGHRAIGVDATWHPGATRPVFNVRCDDGRGGWSVNADAVVVTTPSNVTAEIIRSFSGDLAELLTTGERTAVATLTMAVPQEAIGRELDASGFVVGHGDDNGNSGDDGAADGEDKSGDDGTADDGSMLLAACVWASSKWAHLAGPDATGTEVAILRASTRAGAGDRVAQLSDDALIDALLADLETTMGLTARPSEVALHRFGDCGPRLSSADHRRVEELTRTLADLYPGLFVGGAGVGAIGIPACVAQGHRIATSVCDAWLTRTA